MTLSRSSPFASATLGRTASVALAATAALVLSACGGGSETEPADSAEPTAAVAIAQPLFHLAPVELPAPTEAASSDRMTAQSVGVSQAPETTQSEVDEPYRQEVSADARGADTARLTPEKLAQFRQEGAQRHITASAQSPSVRPAATPAVTVYTPAQIRAAYQMTTVPALAPTSLAARAALGAGQTVYVVSAFNNPNVAADLNTFSKTFGLPTCTAVSTGTATPVKLPTIGLTSGCTFGIVYTTASGATTTKAPAYDATWALETAMDVQWVHAMAPLARIILIQAPDASVASLSNAVVAANNMGVGSVNMSFGAPEGSWVPSYDYPFQKPGMAYFAATGDAGAQVNWPSVSAKVVAVGGTTLNYSSTNRSETAWTYAGGGTSVTTGAPSYQAGLPASTGYRRVADVSMNADPYTGQYVALTRPGQATAWYAAGGTSLSSPQWAGIAAVANAQRAFQGRGSMASLHQSLYRAVWTVPTVYSASLFDVTLGANGTCTGCVATPSYDIATGLGTPKGKALINTLSNLP